MKRTENQRSDSSNKPQKQNHHVLWHSKMKAGSWIEGVRARGRSPDKQYLLGSFQKHSFQGLALCTRSEKSEDLGGHDNIC